MKPALMTLTLTFLLSQAPFSHAQEDSDRSAQEVGQGIGSKVGGAIGKGIGWSWNGVKKGASATKRGVKKGASAVKQGAVSVKDHSVQAVRDVRHERPLLGAISGKFITVSKQDDKLSLLGCESNLDPSTRVNRTDCAPLHDRGVSFTKAELMACVERTGPNYIELGEALNEEIAKQVQFGYSEDKLKMKYEREDYQVYLRACARQLETLRGSVSLPAGTETFEDVSNESFADPADPVNAQ